MRNLWFNLKKIFTIIFGKFNYTAPPWLAFLFKNKKRTALSLVVAVIAVGAYHFFTAQDMRELDYKVSFAPPALITDSQGEAVQQTGREVSIEFFAPFAIGTKFAALDKTGEVITQGIKTSDDFTTGVWRWKDEKTLTFMPHNPWQPDKTFKIKLDSALFNPEYKFNKNLIIKTPKVEGKIAEFSIYTDPLNPIKKTLNAKLVFNYPLAKQDFAKFIRLENADQAELKLEFSQNKLGNEVYIKSTKLTFDKKEKVIKLVVDAGLKTQDGQANSVNTASQNLAIPSIYSLFGVKKVETAIIRNEQDIPTQNLIFEFTDALSVKHLTEKMRVLVLPDDRRWNKESIKIAMANFSVNSSNKNAPKLLPELDINALPSLDLKANPSEREYVNFVSFNFKNNKDDQLLVQLPAQLQSVGKFNLGMEQNFVVNIVKLPDEITIAGKSWLAFNSDKIEVLFKSLNASALEIDLTKLNRRDLIQILTQTKGNLSELNFTNYSFTAEDLGEHQKIYKQVYQKSLADFAYTRVDLKPYLNNKNGFFIVYAKGKRNNYNLYSYYNKNAKLIFVTDLGLIAKRNADSSHNVYVHSLKTNTKVAQATVKVYSRSGKELFSTQTNAEGVAFIPKIKNNYDAYEPVIFTGEKNGDFAFLPFKRLDRALDFSKFNTAGVYASEFNSLRALVFTDRGIYRPGEKVKFGAVIKNSNFTPLKSQYLEVVVNDPNWNQVGQYKVKLNANGIFDLEIETSPSQITGAYTIYIRDMQSHNVIGESVFSVEEFTPASMELSAKINLDKMAWLLPNDLRIDTELKTLYGLGVADYSIQGHYSLYNLDFTFDKYPDYIFKNTLSEKDILKEKLQKTLDSVKTDKDGKAHFSFSLDKLNAGLYALAFEATALDNANTLSAKNTILVSAYERLLGYKTTADLQHIKKLAPVNIDFVLIDRKLQAIKDAEFAVKIYKKHQVSSLVKQSNGNLAYQTITEEKLFKKLELNLAQKPTLNLPSNLAGNYIVRLENSAGIVAMQFDYSVLKTDGSNADSENLALSLDKNIYADGDKVKMHVNVPYSGLALVTLEREKVLKHKWIKVKSGKQSLDFNLPRNVQGSMYINLMLIRSIADANTLSEPLSYAVKELFVQPTKQKINVELTAPKTSQAGESFDIAFKTDKKSSLLIYAVDEGILQVAKYKMPNPLQYFYPKRALEVLTQQMADLIMPGMSILLGMPSGAGVIEANDLELFSGYREAKTMASSSLNPLMRQVKEPVAFWFGIVEADTTPNKIRVAIPRDFNGKLRFMAIATNENSVGHAQAKTNIISPLILSSNLVNYMAQDDSAIFSVSVRNGELDKDKTDIKLNIASDNLIELLDWKNTSFDLKGGEQKVFHFKVKAKSIGVSKFKFVVNHKNYQNSQERSLSIRPMSKYNLQLQVGMAQAKNIKLDNMAPVLPNKAWHKISVATNHTPLLQGLNSYLNNFEHDCTEQLVSKIYPLLSLLQNSNASAKKQYLEKYEKLLDILEARLTNNGDFYLWSEYAKTNDLVSMYVVNFLLDAKAIGLNTRNLEQYSPRFLHAVVRDSKDFYAQSYAIYLLARQNANIFSYLADYQKIYDENAATKNWQTSLAGSYIAAAWHLLGNDEYMDFVKNYNWQNRIYTDYKTDNALNSANSDYINENAQYLYLVAKHFPALLQDIDKTKIADMLMPLSKGELNTLTAGFISVAFGNIQSESDSANAKIKLLADAKELKAANAYLEYTSSHPLENLVIENQNKAWLFYANEKLGFSEKVTPKAQGIEVTRNFYNSKGEELHSFNQGDEVLVKIKLRALDGKVHNNIVISDLLAGGLSLNRKNIENLEDQVDYFDLREDRLNIYLTADENTKVMQYKAKAVCVGEFNAPPIVAESMYDAKVQAISTATKLTITPLK